MKDRPSNIVVFTNQFWSIIYIRICSGIVLSNAKRLQKCNEFVENGEIHVVCLVQDSYRVQIFRCLNCNFIVRIENKKHRRQLHLFGLFC